VQLVAVLATIVFSAVGTFIVFKISALLTKGARVGSRVEETGLDEAVHGEYGFDFYWESKQVIVKKDKQPLN
jgi:Amt family ammonium transporter